MDVYRCLQKEGRLVYNDSLGDTIRLFKLTSNNYAAIDTSVTILERPPIIELLQKTASLL